MDQITEDENVRVALHYFSDIYAIKNRFYKVLNYNNSDIKNRFLVWLCFFNENRHIQCTQNYSFNIESILDIALISPLFKSLTSYEISIAKKIYVQIFETNKTIRFKNQNSAKQLFVLIMVYARFPGMFRKSLINEILKIEGALDIETLEKITVTLLCKYEVPKFLLKHLHLLQSEELDILMRGLQGENVFKHEYFKYYITNREFSELMSLDIRTSTFQNHLLIRSLIYIKILNGNFHNENVLEFLEKNTTFKENPYQYLSEINFWKKAYDLICPFSVNYVGLDLKICVSFLEAKKRKSFVLKGRTTKSISRLIHKWYYEDSDHKWLKLVWETKGKESVEFCYDKVQYKVEELFSGKQLFHEGLKMSNCVFNFVPDCVEGKLSIWSIKKKVNGKYKEYLTMNEVNNSFREEKARFNKMPSDHDYNLIDYCAQLLGFEVLEDNPTRYGGYVMYHCPN